MSKSLHLLLITYHFLPERNVCADRPNSLFKYAAENGIKMSVITTSHPDAVKDTSIFRFDEYSSWNKPPFKIPQIAGKLKAKLVEPFFLNIDYYWYRQIIKANSIFPNVDALYAIYPKAVDLGIAYELSRTMNVPLFTDFTDCIGVDPLLPPNLLQRFTQLSLEKKIIGHSKGVFTIAKTYEGYYRKLLGCRNAFTVYNGYDPDDFTELQFHAAPVHRSGKIKIVHFGNINSSRRRDVSCLFKALTQVKSTPGIPDFEVVFIGRFTREEKMMASKYLLEDCVSFRDYMSKRDGFQLIQNEFDYLLFYGVQGQSSTVCSKLLEYLKLMKPVIGICKGNEAEQIILRAGAGEIADFTAESITSLIIKALTSKLVYKPDHTYIASFDRRVQAKEIFSTIKTLLGTK